MITELIPQELRRSLEAWKENNVSSSGQAVSAQTLYHLGHISLSISVADLYSVIGSKRCQTSVQAEAEDQKRVLTPHGTSRRT